MTTSEPIELISAALVSMQAEAQHANFDSKNPHFKSKYADLSACVEAVIDSLNANGIMLMQETSLDDTGVTVETVFIHESGEQIKGGKLHVPASKQDPQGSGCALTYARRYSLMASCGIAPEDDDGQAASNHKPAFAPKKAEEPLDIAKACNAIVSATSPDKAQHYAEAAMKRATNAEDKARIQNALESFKEAA